MLDLCSQTRVSPTLTHRNPSRHVLHFVHARQHLPNQHLKTYENPTRAGLETLRSHIRSYHSNQAKHRQAGRLATHTVMFTACCSAKDSGKRRTPKLLRGRFAHDQGNQTHAEWLLWMQTTSKQHLSSWMYDPYFETMTAITCNITLYFLTLHQLPLTASLKSNNTRLARQCPVSFFNGFSVALPNRLQK